MKNKFNVGDLVKVVNHEWRGWTGFYGIIITVGDNHEALGCCSLAFQAEVVCLKNETFNFLQRHNK